MLDGFNTLDICLAREPTSKLTFDGSDIDWVFANVITPLLRGEEKCKNRENSRQRMELNLLMLKF